MTFFVLGQEFRSAVPTVQVDPGIKPGSYRFQLVVVDDAGNSSAPFFVPVTILAPPPPPPPSPPSPTGPKLDPRIFTEIPTKKGPFNLKQKREP
jgi:hypothetical protein